MFGRKRLVRAGLLVLLIAVLLAGCNPARDSGVQTASSSSSGTAQASGGNSDNQPTVTVSIVNFKYEPADITVPPGTRIVFVNEDVTPHNVVQGTASQVANANHKPTFKSPELAPGESWELVLDKPGVYDYACTVAGHYMLGMVGTIRVVEGAEIADALTEGQLQSAGSATTGSEHHDMHDHSIHAVTLANLPDNMIATPEGLAELMPTRKDNGVIEFHLDIQEVTHEILEGVPVTAWAFNGILPGPVLRVTEGDLVRVHFTNTHHQPHTIHWHGIYADQKYDGVPHTSLAVMPGESYTYEFVAESPGTFLYHCHVDSYRHIDMGMYGALIIDPKGPKTWDQEYTLILDDWDTNIEPMASMYEPDFNHFLVNGKAFPEVATLPLKIGETTRIRLINVGYNNFAMHMHGPNFQVVASDGHPLPVPYTKDTLDIAPGERYDIEIRPTKAGMYPFHAHNIQYVRNNGVYPGGMHLMINIVDDEE